MQTITKYIDLYEYYELNDDAKERARQEYLETCRDAYFFSDICEENLSFMFPYSDLKVEFSLGYCQGDGFNIYGTICLDDLLDKLTDNFNTKDQRFLRWAFDEFSSMYKMDSNTHYSYCICDRHDYTESVIDDLEWNGYRGIKYNTLEKFNKLSQDYLTDLCKHFEDDGYRFFYEVSDEEMEDISSGNDWMFTSDRQCKRTVQTQQIE